MDRHLASRPSLAEVDKVANDYKLARENFRACMDLFDESPTPETYHLMKEATDLLTVAFQRLKMVEGR